MDAETITGELIAKGYHTDPQRLGVLIFRYVAAERERCAKLAEDQRAYCFDESEEECSSGKCDSAMADAIARKIRELT